MEKLAETMIQRNVAVFCVQETCKFGNFITTIRGHMIIHPEMGVGVDSKGRIRAGVVIILNHVLTKTWTRVGKITPIKYDESPNFPSRIIDVTIFFPCRTNRPKDINSRETNKFIKSFYV